MVRESKTCTCNPEKPVIHVGEEDIIDEQILAEMIDKSTKQIIKDKQQLSEETRHD